MCVSKGVNPVSVERMGLGWCREGKGEEKEFYFKLRNYGWYSGGVRLRTWVRPGLSGGGRSVPHPFSLPETLPRVWE